MPRHAVVNESEEEHEPKTGRRKRAVLATSAAKDSPIRRSTRNRHNSPNPNGSSPESITGAAVTRVTRRRAAAGTTSNLLTVPENPRALRSRKNSASSNVSDNVDNESAPSTPKTRVNKRLRSVEPSPVTPKVGARTRGSSRAVSETKSTPPVVRTTRSTRATSIEPKQSTERVTLTSTPTKRRRQQALARPTEPVVEEETFEDIVEISEDETDDESSPEIKPSKSSSSSAKKLPKNDSTGENTDADGSLEGETSSEKSSPKNISSSRDKSENEVTKESEYSKSPIQIQAANVQATDNTEARNSTPVKVKDLVIKTKRISLDKSKELGMKIEDLINKSTEEQEKSPGNKENEKLNVSPEKIKKNLEFTVSNVNLVRGQSLGSNKVVNKSGDKKNTSLDERVLSKSPYVYVTQKYLSVEEKKILNADQNSRDSKSEKKSQADLPGVVKSPKKNENDKLQLAQNEGEHSSLKTSYTKVDETIVENEIIEEFTLYDSNDDDSKSEFSLTVEDDVDSEKKDSDSKIPVEDDTATKSGEIVTNGNSDADKQDDSDRNSIFDTPNQSKNIKEKKSPSPKRRSSSNTEQLEESSKISKSEKKEDGVRKSTENQETELMDTDSLEIVKNSNEDKNEEEPMETNEHEEDKIKENSVKSSPEKQSPDKRASIKDKIDTTSNMANAKSNGNDQEPDSDSTIAIADLFHNISAEEWNEKQKNNNPQKESKKKRRSSFKIAEKDANDPDDDLVHVREKSLKESETEDCNNEASGSEGTLVLEENNSANKTNKKRKSSNEMIVKDTETAESEMKASPKRGKSPKKATKSNSASTGNETDDKIEEHNSAIPSLSEGETLPSNIDNPLKSRDITLDSEDVGKEEQPASSKNTPKTKKQKSPVKSLTKSKKSDIYEFEDSIEGAENNEPVTFGHRKAKSQQKQERGSKTPKARMNENYSMVAAVDWDSGPENITESDSDGSDNDETMLGSLFNAKFSSDENDDSESDKNESKNTIDSDIAREMNLAGDDNIEYSDDDVPGDDCRDSESEHSDENDNGSDIADFVVPDDEAESSESFEDDSEPKIRFTRILDMSASSDEGEEDQEIDKNDEATDLKHTHKKEKPKSPCKTPGNDSDLPSKTDSAKKSSALEQKKLNLSLESEKSLSIKKTKKGKIVQDLSASEVLPSPSIEDLERSDKKLKKLSNKKLHLNATIDLCTPESNAIAETPGLNTSIGSNKSAKKLKKNLIDDLGASTPDETNAMEINEEERRVSTPKTKTPKKEQKTPKSLKKNQRNSMQLIEEAALVRSNVSDLNKSMSTPNSESPETKFLKKERLNESLPLLELKKRTSKSFDKKALSHMEEAEELEENDASEIEERDDIAEESDNEEGEENDNIEENGDPVNSNGHRDDEEEDETDEEPEKDENEDLNNENENEIEEEESEESSDEEPTVEQNNKSRNESKIETSRRSKERKSITAELEEPDITPSRKQLARRQSIATPGSVKNRKNTESNENDDVPTKMHRSLNTETEFTIGKKRARLESSETPQSLKPKKKMKILAKADVAQDESDSDEAPESLGFGEARTEALQEMRDVAASLKAAKEAKKKKRRDQLERIRKEKEAKAKRAPMPQARTLLEPVKTNLKRLPEDLLENLSDVSQRPKKKIKLSKIEGKDFPSRSMFSPGKSPKGSLKIEESDSPISTGGATTHFSVINIAKVKKRQKKAAVVATFREKMLARNPRQPVSAFLVHQAKQKASGKQLSSRK